jgi:hypothetical protein
MLQDDQAQALPCARQVSDHHFEMPMVRELRPEPHQSPADGEPADQSPPPSGETDAPSPRCETAI